jgi:hypothetical protein
MNKYYAEEIRLCFYICNLLLRLCGRYWWYRLRSVLGVAGSDPGVAFWGRRRSQHRGQGLGCDGGGGAVGFLCATAMGCRGRVCFCAQLQWVVAGWFVSVRNCNGLSRAGLFLAACCIAFGIQDLQRTCVGTVCSSTDSTFPVLFTAVLTFLLLPSLTIFIFIYCRCTSIVDKANYQ